MIKTIIAGLSIAAASTVLAAPAHADSYEFYPCGAGVGVESTVTSCAFAHNVAYAYPYTRQAFGVFLPSVYSPATGQYYSLTCNPGSVTYYGSGVTVPSEVCEGGNNARVAVL